MHAAPRFQTQILSNPKLKKNADDPASGDSLDYLVFPSSRSSRWTTSTAVAAIFYAIEQGRTCSRSAAAPRRRHREHVHPSGHPGSTTRRTTRTRSARTTPVTWPRPRTSCQACGKPNGFTTKFAYSTPSETGPKVFAAEQGGARARRHQR